MSGPSAGRQEAGAPRSGECVFLLTSSSFFPFSPLTLQTLSSLQLGRSDVCSPKGLPLLLTKGNLVRSR